MTDGDLTERAVASYIAKYVSKGHLPGVTLDYRIRHGSQIQDLVVTDHIRTLVSMCWRLGGVPALRPLALRQWAHQLGYRGHVTTKSRDYSTTYAALRETRAAHRREQNGETTTEPPSDALTLARWSYAGSGYTAGQEMFAETIAETIAEATALHRQIAREVRREEVRDAV